MKDQDNKTNNLCYCKDALPAHRLAPKEETEMVTAGKQLKKTNGEKEEAWSVFNKWYWI